MYCSNYILREHGEKVISYYLLENPGLASSVLVLLPEPMVDMTDQGHDNLSKTEKNKYPRSLPFIPSPSYSRSPSRTPCESPSVFSLASSLLTYSYAKVVSAFVLGMLSTELKITNISWFLE